MFALGSDRKLITNCYLDYYRKKSQSYDKNILTNCSLSLKFHCIKHPPSLLFLGLKSLISTLFGSNVLLKALPGILSHILVYNFTFTRTHFYFHNIYTFTFFELYSLSLVYTFSF